MSLAGVKIVSADLIQQAGGGVVGEGIGSKITLTSPMAALYAFPGTGF